MATTEFTARAIVIVESAQVDSANQQARYIDPDGGEFAWTVGLSPSGDPPATHCWNDWQMMPSQRDELQSRLENSIPGHYQWFELDSWDPGVARPTPDEVLELSIPVLKRIEVDL